MLLTRFRVTEFRSVEDSGWIEADVITALIGTNESGKTNILLPLWKLNPAEGGEIVLSDDLPRSKYHIYRNATQKPFFISAEYNLLDEEIQKLVEMTKCEPPQVNRVIVKRDFDGNYKWEFPNYDERPAITAHDILKCVDEHKMSLLALNSISTSEETRRKTVLNVFEEAKSAVMANNNIMDSLNKIVDNLESVTTKVEASSSFASLEEFKVYVNESIKELSKPSITENVEIQQYLKEKMPKYVYYSNYGNLDSQIYLPQVIQNFERKDLGVKDSAKVRTLRTLFAFVKLDPKEITALGADSSDTSLPSAQIQQIAEKKKEREILLSSASAEFTKSFNEWWKQGNYTFEFQADGNFFRIWVSDKVRPERIELESRSTGLQWFFSFYLVFLVESKKHHKNAVLLLDEPGVTLHPLAQKNLFLFFENLAKENQIIYTTHSPFMVDPNHLERVRSIYIDQKGKTVASPDLRASEKLNGKNQPQSIYPAHAALGLTVSDTLLINCEPVLVEGESDQIYLSALKSLLISKGKISPLKELVFIPTGGTRGIKATSSILSGVNKSKPVILVDGDKPGIKIANELKHDFYAESPEKIINISNYTSLINGEIEDIFPVEQFSEMVSKFLPRPEEVEDEFNDVVTNNAPMCDQIEKYAKSHGIELKKGWKVRLAITVKREILRGKDKIISERDDAFTKIVTLFNAILEQK